MHIRWRGLELPSQVVCDLKTLSNTYGKILTKQNFLPQFSTKSARNIPNPSRFGRFWSSSPTPTQPRSQLET